MVQKNNTKRTQEDLMPHPIVCQDERLHQYLQTFQALFSRPQYKHFVTVLMGLLLGQSGHTLSHIYRAVSGKKSLSSLSRFFSAAPWDHHYVNQYNFSRFSEMMQAKIDEERQRKCADIKKQNRRGRRSLPLVTGYLIGDDSTMFKPKGVKMQGLGKHHSTTYDTQVIGHSLVETLYTVLDRSCPLEPLLYRQKKTAEKENVPFVSKIDLMVQQIQKFIAPSGTETHVLLDTWYNCKSIWKAARDRKFNITTGMKRNRWMRVPCAITEDHPKGWKWQKLEDYVASLPEEAYQQCFCPRNPEEKVWVHVVDTRVRKLYRCKIIIVRKNLNDPLSLARFWVTSALQADAQTCLNVISLRWEIEVFFEDMKELLGIDQYQLMTTTALLRYWTLCWIAFSFLEEVRNGLKYNKGKQELITLKMEMTKEYDIYLGEYRKTYHATLGQAMSHVQETHQKLFLEWVYHHALSGTPVQDLHAHLAA
jgi:SRSO17 transposase